MKNTLRSPYFLALFATLGLGFAPLGCGEKVDDDGGVASTETSGGDGDGDATDTTGDGDGDGDTTGDGDGEPTTGDGDGEPEPCEGDGANGTACNTGCDCASTFCRVLPILGGQCGECVVDADCPDGGCSLQSPFENNGPTCNMGEPGGGCESTEVCQDDLVCGNVLSLGGFIEVDTCGFCEDGGCEGDLICTPVVLVEEFSGINTCVEPGSFAQDAYCDIEGNGDAACADFCSPVLIEGIITIGACGECVDNDDCGADETCSPGAFDLGLGSLTGSTCVPN